MTKPKPLTEAQAEVFSELWGQGYGSMGFLPHEMFRNRDNRDNRSNGMRRTMRNMIKSGLFTPDTRTHDGSGNHYYHFTPAAKEAFKEQGERA